jgi:hypothetical protein
MAVLKKSDYRKAKKFIKVTIPPDLAENLYHIKQLAQKQGFNFSVRDEILHALKHAIQEAYQKLDVNHIY